MKHDRGTLRALACVLAVSIACVLLAVSGQAASGDQGLPPGAKDPGIPALIHHQGWDPTDAIADAAPFSLIHTVASKPKQAIDIKDVRIMMYAHYCLKLSLGPGFAIQTCCPDVFDTSTCPSDSVVTAPEFNASLESSGIISWTRVSGPSWVVSPGNASTSYGQFAPVRVNMVAFGSIPVTATVHLSQAKDSHGLYSPMDADYTTENVGLPYDTSGSGSWTHPGVDSLDGWGLVPYDGGARGAVFFALPSSVKGPIDIRISDVSVDGVPVEVGPDCRTSKPGQLTATPPGGFYYQDIPASEQPAGSAGRWAPLGSDAGLFDANMSIPGFAGCHNGAEDLDPLLAGITSAPVNLVTIHQKSPIDSCSPRPGYDCPPYPIDEVSPPATAGASQMAQPNTGQRMTVTPKQEARGSEAARTLTAKQRSKLVAVIAKLAPNVRQQMLASASPQALAMIQAIKK